MLLAIVLDLILLLIQRLLTPWIGRWRPVTEVGVWSYLTTAASWQGEDGIVHRLWEHVWLSGVSVLLACLLALPLGIGLGHLGRGGAVAINLANVGRAIPTLGVLILFAVSPLGLTTAP